MATEQFQAIWSSLLWERSDETFDTKLELLQQLVDEGADINFPFYSSAAWDAHTPLYYLLHVYRGAFDTLNVEQCDTLFRFLMQNGATPNALDIKVAMVRPKVLEQILYFASEEDIQIHETRIYDPLTLEVLLGFPSVTLDQEYSYEMLCGNFAYGRFDLLFIEACLMDYATERGFPTTEERQEIIRILKRNGTPQPRVGRLKEMLDLLNNEQTTKRFREAFEYWKSI